MMETVATSPSIHAFLIACIALVSGLLLGSVHFGLLWWNARLYASGGAFRALAVQLLRFGLLLAALAVLAHLGALALLAGALGVFLGRTIVLRRFGRVS